jgi:hypothetical protein
MGEKSVSLQSARSLLEEMDPIGDERNLDLAFVGPQASELRASLGRVGLVRRKL